MPIEDNSASVRGYWQARIAADTFAKSVGRSEVEPNAEFAEFSVVKTHFSSGF
jgi:hypothetical protein